MLTAREALNVGLAFAPVQQHIEEITPFLAWMQQRYGEQALIVEIGAGRGGLTRALLECTDERVISVDDPEGDGGIGAEAARERDTALWVAGGVKFNAITVTGQSTDPVTLQKVRHALRLPYLGIASDVPEPIDVLFIDGDHRGDQPERDYDAYLPLMSKTGIIAFHDIDSGAHPGVRAIFEKLRMRHPASIVFSGGHGWGGIGVLILGNV